MERRGFTILELLVVLTLLVVVSGLVMPSIMERMAASVLESATSRIDGAAGLCRAEAQQRGLPVRMVARADRRGVVSIYAEVVDVDLPGGRPDRLVDPDLEPVGVAERGGRAGDYPIYTLPDGYRFSDEPPHEDFPSLSSPERSEAGGSFLDPELMDAQSFSAPGAGDSISPVQLALYLPDGSAIVSGPLYLLIGDEVDRQVFTVALSRFTGGCEVRPLPARRPDQADPEGAWPTDRPASPGSNSGQGGRDG